MFFRINDLGVFSENSGTPEKTPRNSKHHRDIFNPLVHFKDGELHKRYCFNRRMIEKCPKRSPEAPADDFDIFFRPDGRRMRR